MNKWYFAKVGTFMILFVAVVMTAQHLRSEGFLGGLRPKPRFEFVDITQNLVWCPKGTQTISVESLMDGGAQAKVFSSKRILKDLCRIRIQSFESAPDSTKTFRTILRAENAKNQSESLEVDQSGRVFQYKGLPFRSKELEGMLKTIPNTGS